jgi:four helix bundle protein
MDLAQSVYAAARLMPKQEEFRLTAQMIRAAVSIPANIAEGHARATRKDYAHFISISRGSAAELEMLLLLALRADFLRRTSSIRSSPTQKRSPVCSTACMCGSSKNQPDP